MLSIDPTTDAALADAFVSLDRRIVPKIEIDWNRDGLFSHAYSDLSAVIDNVKTDRSTATMLPQEINALTGYSSGQLTATLVGRRAEGELLMSELFDPYNQNSPLYNTGSLLLPIRFSRITSTAIGDVSLPVFNGFIRSAPFSRKNASVDITAGDHEDFQGTPVTLPLWAVLTTSQDFAYSQSLQFDGASRPSNIRWFVEELLRQAGRPGVPEPRTDAVAYHTCSGSMLPTVGDRVDVNQLPRVTVANPNFSNSVAWVDGPFGLVQDKLFTTYNTYSTSAPVIVPTVSSGVSPVSIGFSMFALGGFTGNYTEQHFYLEDYISATEHLYPTTWEDPEIYSGNLWIRVYSNGNVEVHVDENFAGMSGGSRYRVWNYTSPTLATDSWHNYNIIMKFTSTSMTPELRVDGVVKTLTASGSNPAMSGYRFRTVTLPYQNGGTISGTGRSNVVHSFNQIPHCHVQWYVGDATLAYNSHQSDIRVQPNGKPYSVIGDLLAEIAFVPDVQQAGAWDTLKDIMTAELGILWIDEFGTVHVAARSTAQNITVPLLLASISLTDDQLDELVVLPTSDSKRNTIVTTWGFAGELEGIVYQQSSPTERPVGLLDSVSSIQPLSGVTGVNPVVTAISATAPTGDPLQSLWFGQASAIKISDITVQATGGWGFNVVLGSDSRYVNFVWSGNSNEDIYLGAYIGGSQADLYVAGRYYSDVTSSVTSYKDAADVATYGARILQIGGNSPWFQVAASAQAISNSLLLDTVHPAPMVENIQVPSDARRQLFDIIRIVNDVGSSGVLFGQILSKTTSDDNTGASTDTLTLRIVNTPNTWLLGITGASELGSHTLLS